MEGERSGQAEQDREKVKGMRFSKERRKVNTLVGTPLEKMAHTGAGRRESEKKP